MSDETVSNGLPNRPDDGRFPFIRSKNPSPDGQMSHTDYSCCVISGTGKVLLAMSGGVDSSVAAALLLRAGYETLGDLARAR